MPVDIRRYLKDDDYRRQVIQEDIRARKEQPPAKPYDGVNRQRDMADDEETPERRKLRLLRSFGFER